MVCNTKLVKKNIKQQKTRLSQKAKDGFIALQSSMRALCHRVLYLLVELRQCHLVVWDNPQHWDKEQQ